jgi:CheY-like chemotaxis protein
MKHVLIIEDDKDILSLLAEFLQDEGFLVSTAENGIKALEFLNSTARLPQLILLDLMMPQMDGTQFRKEQEKIEIIKNIPVILMSADSRIDLIRKEINIEYHLKKPLDIDDLIQTINSVLAS